MNDTKKAKFELGNIYITPGAQEAIPQAEVLNAIARHVTGNWGDVCPADAVENEFSLGKNRRLLSVYHSSNGTKFWIITEANREATTVLLPDEH